MDDPIQLPPKRRGPIGVVLSAMGGNQLDEGLIIVSIGGVVFLLMGLILGALALAQFSLWLSR